MENDLYGQNCLLPEFNICGKRMVFAQQVTNGRVLVKRQLTVLVKTVGKYSGGKSKGLHCVYRQKIDNRIQTGSL